MKTFKLTLYVQVEDSDGVSPGYVAEYVYDAVSSWGGGGPPDAWSWPSNLTVWGTAQALKKNPAPPKED